MLKSFFKKSFIFNAMQKKSGEQPFVLCSDPEGDTPIKRRLWKPFIVCLASLNLILPSLVIASSPSPRFSGFNASVGAGLEMPVVSTKGELKNNVPGIENLIFNVSREESTNQINGNLRVGYNLIFKNFYLIGLAGDATFGSNSLKFSTNNFETNSDLRIQTNANIILSNQFALLLKFGRLVGARTLFYGLIGPRWGDFSLQFDATFHQNVGVIIDTQLESQKKYYKQGVLFGIGSEFLLTNCISLALEYRYTYYGHPNLPPTEAAVTQDGVVVPNALFSQTSRLSALSNDFMLRLGLYF